MITALNDEGYSVTVIALWDEYSPRLSELGKHEFIEMETNGPNPLKDLVYRNRKNLKVNLRKSTFYKTNIYKLFWIMEQTLFTILSNN